MQGLKKYNAYRKVKYYTLKYLMITIFRLKKIRELMNEARRKKTKEENNVINISYKVRKKP